MEKENRHVETINFDGLEGYKYKKTQVATELELLRIS